MTVSRIEHKSVRLDTHQHLHLIYCLRIDAYCSSHEKTAFGVLAGDWIVLDLHDVLVGDQAGQLAVPVHYQQFLYLVLSQKFSGLLQIAAVSSGDQVLLGHHFTDGSLGIVLETKVPVGDNSAEHPVCIHYGYTADMVLTHDLESVTHSGVVTDGHRIVYHAVLRPLDLAHLLYLHIDRHILVYHSDTALACYGYSQICFCNCIHSSGHDRSMEGYLPGQSGADIHLTRQYVGVRGYEKYVIKR